MTDDRSLERAARSWIEAGPTQAPDRAVEAALLRIETTSQERDWHVPWRLPKMSTPVRVATAAAIGVLAIGGALFVLRPTYPSVGGPGTAPSPTPMSTQTQVVIPDGTYLGTPQPIADVRALLDADTTLTSGEKAAIVDDVLGIGSGTTYQTRIEIHGSTFVVSQGVDGVFAPETWTIEPAGGRRIVAEGYIEFSVEGCDRPEPSCEFTLRAVSDAPSPVEAFVRRLVFETSGPFVPQT